MSSESVVVVGAADAPREVGTDNVSNTFSSTALSWWRGRDASVQPSSPATVLRQSFNALNVSTDRTDMALKKREKREREGEVVVVVVV